MAMSASRPGTIDDEIEAFAWRVLFRNVVTAPPVNVDEVAQREGLNFEVDAFPDDRTSGFYFDEPNGRGRAVINARHHRLRQRFTKAHELAHHLIDEPVFVRATGMPYLQLASAHRGRGRHWAHERFAGALLMPRPWLGDFMRQKGWQLERDPLIVAVARAFDVSRAAAEVRLRELGYIERGA